MEAYLTSTGSIRFQGRNYEVLANDCWRAILDDVLPRDEIIAVGGVDVYYNGDVLIATRMCFVQAFPYLDIPCHCCLPK